MFTYLSLFLPILPPPPNNVDVIFKIYAFDKLRHGCHSNIDKGVRGERGVIKHYKRIRFSPFVNDCRFSFEISRSRTDSPAYLSWQTKRRRFDSHRGQAYFS